MRVTLLTGVLPHYRGPFLRALTNSGVDLTVLVAGREGRGHLGLAPDAVPFTVRRLRSARGPRWRTDVVRAILESRPDVLVSEHGASLDYVWTALLSPALRRIPLALWTHGIARQELYGGRRGLASRGRWWQLKRADGVVCYDSDMAVRVAEAYPDKVVGAAPNSNEGASLLEARKRALLEGPDALRRRLGLTFRQNLVSVSRLVAEKEVRRLVPILMCVRALGAKVGLVVIGSGPEEEALQHASREAGLRSGRDIIFAGGVSDPGELGEWLSAVDLCVSPGYLGLNVVDCLFAGVPIAGFLPGESGPWHSPEWKYLEPGLTGYFAAENSNEALARVCFRYLAQAPGRRHRISDACTRYALEHLGIHNMVAGMRGVLEKLASH